MTSKIEGYPSAQPVISTNTQSTKSAGNKANVEAADSAGADQLTLTSSARSLQKIADVVANAPVVDAQKVASTKLAISNGTYQINSASVADKLLQLDSKLK